MGMSLWQMSFSGSILILVILAIRGLSANRIPPKVFPVLWAVAALRLAVPFGTPSPFSVYTLLGQNDSVMNVLENAHMLELLPLEDGRAGSDALGQEEPRIKGDAAGYTKGEAWDNNVGNAGKGSVAGNAGAETENISRYAAGITEEKDVERTQSGKGESVSDISGFDGEKAGNLFRLWNMIWAAGTFLATVSFSFTYLRCRREFASSLPVEHLAAQEWLGSHRLRRPVVIRSSGCIPAPLTYGVLRPVILVPSGFDWEDTQSLCYVLEHEFVHIQRLDALAKLAMTGILCVHWFNPLVWVMYVLFNRDLELTCDAAVIHRFGLESRADYAHTLIYMEEKRSGFLPLYNGFGKYGVEERIRAIMKSGRTSIAAALAAVCLVLVAVGAFATPAMEKNPRKFLTAIPGGDFTQEESRKLFDLWIEDYEEMRISQYRDLMLKTMDAPGYGDLCSRLSEAELVYEMPEGDKADALEEYLDYFHFVLMPLTADQWENREFSDCVTTEFPFPADNAILEYVVSLHVSDGNRLTVGEYARVHVEVKEALREFLQGKTVGELRDGEEMVRAVHGEFDRVSSQESTDSLEVSVTGIFQPLGGYGESEALLYKQIGQQIRRQWEEALAPFVPFGLSYEFREDWGQDGLEITMYYQGQEVKGIFDEETGAWISEHAGNTTYSSNAVELMTVYENGKLAGLRPASEEEQQMWEEQRNAVSRQREAQWGQTVSKENEEQEPRMFPHGAKEDYDSLLALKTKDYQSMTLEKFNGLVLDWCNEDYERMEAIGEDAARNECQVSLTAEEKDFVALTLSLSREENRCMVESLQTGKARKDPQVDGGRLTRQAADGIGWCCLDYGFTYHIADEKSVTVGERDRCVGAMLAEIRGFWQNTSVEELVGLKGPQVAERFREMASRCGSRQVEIRVDEERIHFDKTGAAWENAEKQQNVVFEWVELMEYEDTGWPYFAHSLVNNTDKTITEIQYCMLAYDGEGNPLELYWNFLDSQKEHSYENLVTTGDVSIWPHERWGSEGGWNLYDGPRMPEWPRVGDGGANQAVYGIYAIRQITFGDGTVWKNEAYEGWLEAYRGKRIPVGELESYYPYKVKTE